MPNLRFYDIAGDPSHKALGFETFSPEEAQLYERALTVEIPEGSNLIVRRRRTKQGRTELIAGVAKIGESFVLVGEEDGADPKANPPAPVTRALDIPERVTKASDEELEIMAAQNGVAVDDRWRKRNRALRNADVARKMKERKESPQTAGV